MGDMADYYTDSLFDDDEPFIHRPKRKTEWVELQVKKVLMSTAKAFLCRLEDDTESWVPKSQIQDADDIEAGDTELTLLITEWIASRLEPAEKKSIYDQKAKGGHTHE